MDKIQQVITEIKDVDSRLMNSAQQRLDFLTKPQGSLGRLEELAKIIVGICGKENPLLDNKVIFTLAGDHGVVQEGVSAFPQEVTPQMVYNFLNNGAGINVLARHVGAKVIVVDMGVATEIKSKHEDFRNKKIGLGTKNFAKGPAMTNLEAVKSIEAGMDLINEELKNGLDIVGIGEMGIGNTTPASAIASVITREDVAKMTGRGTGINDDIYEHKIGVIRKAISVNKPDPKDAIDILSKVGGFEIGGMFGIILAACANRIPVVIDGFISTSAALLTYLLEPKTAQYMVASHVSVEPGHKIILEHMGLRHILDLNLRLGEGTGAALGINLVEASVKILTQMATFKDAGVSKGDK